ncbi:MAG: hypothetical protein ACSHX6_08225 [Akkermansiaceae bacterium]
MENNPYATPSTPSDQMENISELPELANLEAYRIGYAFFCKPDFQSPPICYKTGNPVNPSLEKTALFIGPTSIALYITHGGTKEIDWIKLFRSFALILCAIATIATAALISSALLSIPLIFIIPFLFKAPRNHGIELLLLDSGFIRVLDAHPNFLKRFPDRRKNSQKQRPYLERSP